MGVYKVASVSVHAAEVISEILTLLRLVLHVQLVVTQQLMRSMGEFALLLVGTEPRLHIPPAQL